MGGRQQWYAGVDWGKPEPPRRSDRWRRSQDRREKLQTWRRGAGRDGRTWLMAASCAAEPGQILAAIEVPHGPVVETLMERGFKVHAINPKQMDRFRDRFTMAGAKDDSRDAEVMALPPCAPIRVASARSRPPTRSSSSCANGRASPRISASNGTASSTACASSAWRYFPALLGHEDDAKRG